ncbi:MAG: glycogen-binding domain-containing protein [Longimicrobiales bacterium]
MRPEIQQYLDGEVRFDELSGELQEQARAWDRLMGELEHGPAVEIQGGGAADALAPSWIEDAVMDEISLERPLHGPTPDRRGFVGWLVRPKEIRVSPLFGGLAAAALAALILLPGNGVPSGTDENGGAVAATIYVQFLMEAPSARTVAVAGDFNDWAGEHELVDPDGDGVWTGRIAVQPGIHEYMFVVDGEEWVTPPGAEGYRDDGFGNRNGVVTVLPTA